jgi:Family of unknown function (DUF6519)/Domain of unknown function (DUF4815)
MRGDFSRSTYRPERHYSAVLQQQGRVAIDSDFNEHAEIDRHRLRQLARDLIGPCGGPRDGAGFNVTLDAGGSRLVIGAGRYYVDGLLVENEAESVVDLARHPLPGPLLVYLEVWERTVTAVEDPELLEAALGGPDTSGRLQIGWRVRLEPSDEADCDDGPARASLRVQTPGGYRGPENRLYRVEVHAVDDSGKSTFKWSRDNGSLVMPVAATDGELLTVAASPGDALERLTAGEWIELLDDSIELEGGAGQLVRIVAIEPGKRLVACDPSPSPVDESLHPEAIRWHGTGATTAGAWLRLEDGIEIAFDGGPVQPGDYWIFPARPMVGRVEWPDEPVPASRLDRFRCPLAVIERSESQDALAIVEDRRRLFAPIAG